MHYTDDLDCDVDLKQEAIATIEHIAQYMGEDELLYHSRPLALAYLALTEDDSVPVVHGRWGTGRFNLETGNYEEQCTHCRNFSKEYGKPYCPNCGTKMDGGADHETD